MQVIERVLQKDRYEKTVEVDKKQNYITLNNEAYETLFNLLPQPHVENQTLYHTTMKDIKILNIPHMKAFIHTSMFEM